MNRRRSRPCAKPHDPLPARQCGACAAGAAAGDRAGCAQSSGSEIRHRPRFPGRRSRHTGRGNAGGILNDPEFAAGFLARQPGRSGVPGRSAGIGTGGAGQWPNRPAGGDRRRSPDPGFQDQPPAARPRGRRERASIWPRWRSTAPPPRAFFPGRRIVCGLVWTDGPFLMRLSERPAGRPIGPDSAPP